MSIVAAMAMLAAQPVPAAASGQDLVAALRTCSTVVAADQRLACYDRAAAALAAAVDSKTVAIVDRETVRRTQRSLFGFLVPKLPLFGMGESGKRGDDEIKEVMGTVQSVRSVAPDHFEIRLEDGAVWKNTDLFRETPVPGDKVRIVKATLGSYFLSAGRSRIGTRCIRVR